MKIEAYEYQHFILKGKGETGGFDPATKELRPFTEFEEVEKTLDALTLACEAGLLDTETWVSQLFATTDVFNEFLEELESFDYGHINSQWYWALQRITGHYDQEGFITCNEIAGVLGEKAANTGQI